RLRRPSETLDDVDELVVRGTPGVAKRADVVFIREPAQAHQLAGALAPGQLQLGRPIGEQEARHLGRTDELAEFRRRIIYLKQHENPERYRDEAMPGECGDEVCAEITGAIALDEREMHEALRQARKEHRDPIDSRLEQDGLDEGRPIE